MTRIQTALRSNQIVGFGAFLERNKVHVPVLLWSRSFNSLTKVYFVCDILQSGN